MTAKKKILIIGGSSFVAKNFVLENRNTYDISFVNRSQTGYKSELIFPDFFKIEDSVFKNIDVVLNCAAIVHQETKVADQIYFDINQKLALDLAEKAKSAGVSTFIQLSTIAVYGEVTHISEKTIPNPSTPYGKSKLAADTDLEKLTDKSFSVALIRPPMIYGGNGAPGNMIKLINLVGKGIPLPFKGIENNRDFIHVKNLIGFINAVINQHKSGTFLVSDHAPISIAALNTIIVKTLGIKNKAFRAPNFLLKLIKNIKPNVYSKLFGSLTIDIGSTLSILDFKPNDLIEEGINEMVNFNKNDS